LKFEFVVFVAISLELKIIFRHGFFTDRDRRRGCDGRLVDGRNRFLIRRFFLGMAINVEIIIRRNPYSDKKHRDNNKLIKIKPFFFWAYSWYSQWRHN